VVAALRRHRRDDERPRRQHLIIVGGTSTGQTVADNCDARAHLPELATNAIGATSFGPGWWDPSSIPSVLTVHVAYGVLTAGRGLSSYVVPRVGVQRVGDVPEQTGPDARGELRRAELRGGAIAGKAPVRQRTQRHRQPRAARHDVWQPHQPTRLESGQRVETPPRSHITGAGHL
jgi:hypothetical protein